MGLRSNQYRSGGIGRRLHDVEAWLRLLRKWRNNPFPEFETFIDLNPAEMKTILRNLIETDSKNQAVRFEYEYLYSLNFHSDKTPGPPISSPEGGMIGRKTIRLENDFRGP
jgi:hypothetical protein